MIKHETITKTNFNQLLQFQLIIPFKNRAWVLLPISSHFRIKWLVFHLIFKLYPNYELTDLCFKPISKFQVPNQLGYSNNNGILHHASTLSPTQLWVFFGLAPPKKHTHKLERKPHISLRKNLNEIQNKHKDAFRTLTPILNFHFQSSYNQKEETYQVGT